MSKQHIDLILHPIRLRIATELSGRQLSSGELRERLADVPQATLYRQIKLLFEGGVLEVAEERQVNGAIERIYQLAGGKISLTPEDLREISEDEHLRYFATFAASLIDSFGRYLQATDLQSIGEDGMSYNRAVIYLNAEERQQFRQDVMALIGRVSQYGPTPDRQAYTLASIVIPQGKKDEYSAED